MMEVELLFQKDQLLDEDKHLEAVLEGSDESADGQQEDYGEKYDNDESGFGNGLVHHKDVTVEMDRATKYCLFGDCYCY